MRNSLLALLCLAGQFVAAQQSTLHGTVAVFNSRFETGTRQFVANAQVEEDYGKSQATTTNANGTFKLSLIGIKDEEKVFYSVKKTGFEVVNADALQAVAGQAESTQVFMAPEGKIAENQLKYYKINREASEKALTEKLKSLEKQIAAAQADAAGLKRLQEEYGQLQSQFDKIEESARELAGRYARTNLDDVSADYQRAFRCFQRGQLDSALLIFKAIDLEAGAAGIISEQGRNADLAAEYARRNSEKNKSKRETNEALQFKAQLHQTQFQFDKAESCFELLLKLDSSNLENLWLFANYLREQNRAAKAIGFYQKILAHNPKKFFESVVYGHLALCFQDIQNYSQSESMYLKALEAKKSLQKKYKSAALDSDIADVMMNFGTLLKQESRFEEALKTYNGALNIYSELSKKYLAEIEPLMARTYMNLGILYKNMRRLKQAESSHLSALKIYDRWTAEAPGKFDDDIARVCLNLAMVYGREKTGPQAEAYFIRSKRIREGLVQKNPARFEPDLAKTLTNYADFCTRNSRYREADSLFTVAGMLWSKCRASSLEQYGELLAWHNGLHADCLIRSGQYRKATDLLESTLGLFNTLTKVKNKSYNADCITDNISAAFAWENLSDIKKSFYYLDKASFIIDSIRGDKSEYQDEVAVIQLRKGMLYLKTGGRAEAEKNLKEATDRFSRLVLSDTAAYEFYLAESRFNLGYIYENQGKNAEAEQLYLGSLQTYEKLAKKDSLYYRSELATNYLNLSNMYADNSRLEEAESLLIKAYGLFSALSLAEPEKYEQYMAGTTLNLGNCYARLGKTSLATDMYDKTLKIRTKMAVNNPELYSASLGKAYMNIGNFNAVNGYKIEALSNYNKSLDIYRALAKNNPDQYAALIENLSNNIYLLGIDDSPQIAPKKEPSLAGTVIPKLEEALKTIKDYNSQEKYAQSRDKLIETLRICTFKMKGDHNAYDHIYMNILSEATTLRKIFEQKNQFTEVVNILAEVDESLEYVNQSSDGKYTQQYENNAGALSWFYLFVRSYAKAEKAALNALAIDKNQIWIIVNLSHALLFQNRYDEAVVFYTALKDAKDESGKSYAQFCLDDLDALEKAGITHPDISKIRELLQQK